MVIAMRHQGLSELEILRILLRRCRSVLSPEDDQWEEDVGTAIANEEVLVANIDLLLA